MRPKLSVCMPVFNTDRFLDEAISSVLSQTFHDYELVIIDDQSTDRSRKIIESYAARDERIVFRVNERNLGLPGNWNACLMAAQGEYIKFLFGDDVLSTSHALERYVASLEHDPDIVLAASSRYLIDERSTVIGVSSDLLGTGTVEGTHVIIDNLIDQQNIIGEPSTVIFRKKHASRGFLETYRQIVDLEMWFHLLEQGKFHYIDEPLCSFRIHPDQATRKNFEQGLYFDDTSQLLHDYGTMPYVRLSAYMRTYMNFAPAYGIWKLHRKHRKIKRENALKIIQDRYHFTSISFFAFKPFYRLTKYYRRWRKWLRRVVFTRLF